MKTPITILLLACALVACGASTTHTVRHASGELRWQVEMKSGLPHGLSETWNATGTKTSRGYYREGKKHGRFIYYRPEGGVDHEEEYRFGESVWISTSGKPAPADSAAQAWDESRELRVTESMPSFATLDRFDDANRFGAELGVHRLDDLNTGYRVDVSGQYYVGKWGGYLRFAGSSLDVFDTRGNASSNLDLGVIRSLPAVPVAPTLRLGLSIPTGSDTMLDNFVANATSYQRITDVSSVLPNAMVARTSLSASAQHGLFFYRSDVGADLALNVAERDASAGSALADDVELIVRANAGAGVLLPHASVALELANTWLSTGDGDTGELWLHSAGLRVGGRLHHWQPWLALIAPLDDGVRGNLVVVAGLELAGMEL